MLLLWGFFSLIEEQVNSAVSSLSSLWKPLMNLDCSSNTNAIKINSKFDGKCSNSLAAVGLNFQAVFYVFLPFKTRSEPTKRRLKRSACQSQNPRGADGGI